MKKQYDILKISVSFDKTYHILDGKPLYEEKFLKVMSFHPPGLAPALDETGAFHINYDGNPVYKPRYVKTFGFYNGLAAVETGQGWCHINPKGNQVYDQLFNWVGNFQGGFCVVRNKAGEYCHILPTGEPLYQEKYEYVGDYRNGIAVIKKDDGLAYHIDRKGKILYESNYSELDVFHKGFARAKDQYGWCHVKKNGEPAYKARFLSVESFYNGNALVKKYSGKMGIIDEDGQWIKSLKENLTPQHEVKKYYQNLLVGYWKSQTIYAAVRLNILEELAGAPNTVQNLSAKLNLDYDGLWRLVKALRVIELVELHGTNIHLTDEGTLFTEQHPNSLKFATLLWGDEHYASWHRLPESIQNGQPAFNMIYGKNFFKWLNDHPSKLDVYHKAISIYSMQDYGKIPEVHDFSIHKTILDLGGGKGVLLSYILQKYPQLEGILLEQDLVLQTAAEFLKDQGVISRCTLIKGDFFGKIPVKCDAIVMSRVIHDWNDTSSLKILENCCNALNKDGTLYIVEILYPDNVQIDRGVFLNLNMLVITGGKERTKDEFQKLLHETGFILTDIKPINSLLSLIVATKE